MDITKKIPVSFLTFILSIAILSCVFIIHRTYMSERDEGDHLAVAYFMTEGKVLYTDIFSHHFPFPYYWIALFSPLWQDVNPARTVSIFRLSLLAVYVITFASVFLSSTSNKTRYALSIWILSISTFLILYRGNLVLSETFVAVCLSAVAWIALPILLKWEENTHLKMLVAGIFCSISFWTQPLTIFLFLIPLLLIKKSGYKIQWIVLMGIINVVPVAILLITGQLRHFVEQAVWYNFAVYAKMFPNEASSSERAIQYFQTFLANEKALFTHIHSSSTFVQFILHSSIIIAFVRFLMTHQYKALIITTLLFFTSRVRELKITASETFNYGIYPFLLLSSVFFILLCFSYLGKRKALTIFLLGIFMVVSCTSMLPILRESLSTDVSYHLYWGDKQRKGELIQKITHKDESILVYTNEVEIYLYSNDTLWRV